MPTKCGKKDSKGTYCQWGSHGAHYYYTPGDKASMEKARKKADAQGAAAYAHGYRGSKYEESEGEMEDNIDCSVKKSESTIEQLELELAKIKEDFEKLKESQLKNSH